MYLYISAIFATILFVSCIYNLKLINLHYKDYIKTFIILACVLLALVKHENLGIPATFIILSTIIYKKGNNVILTLITVMTSIIIIILADYLSATLVLTNILKINVFNIEGKGDIRILLLHYPTMFIFQYLICYIVRFINKGRWNLKQLMNFKTITFGKKFYVFLIITLAITFIIFYINSAMFINVNVSSNFKLGLNTAMFLLYFIMLGFIYLAFSTNVKKEMEMNHKKIELENLKEYTQNLERLYNEMRGFRHDYINILSSMLSYMDENNMEGLKEYFQSHIIATGQKMEHGNFRLGQLQNIQIPEIKGLIASKTIRAQEFNIETFIDIIEPVDKINMDIIDLCRVIGILIDNGVEAACECEVKELKIAIVNKKNSVVIVIINSCIEDMPPVHKLFEKGFSTKGEGRGLGLSNLNRIIDRYKNISLDTIVENNEFTQVLEILI